MSDKVVVQKQGITWLGALCLLFIGLKLAGVINWSWWWVFAPIWGPIGLVLAIVALMAAVAGAAFGIAALLDKLGIKKKKKKN